MAFLETQETHKESYSISVVPNITIYLTAVLALKLAGIEQECLI
jgi:hypothetical protein